MSLITSSQLDDLEFLAQVSQLWTEVDLDRALKQVVRLAVKAVGAVRASLFIQDHRALRLSNFIYGDEDFLAEESAEVLQQVIQHGLAGWVLRHGEGAIIGDTSTDGRWYHIPGTLHQAGSALSVPFRHEDTVLGVITLVHDQPHAFTEHHLRLMTIITNQVALAVHNAQSFQQIKTHRTQLETILQVIPDMLLVLDRHGCIVIASDAVAGVLGDYPVSSIMGYTLPELVSLDALFADIHKALEVAEQKGGDWSFETHAQRSSRDLLVHLLKRENVSPDAGYLIVMNDVTALRNLSRFKDGVLRMVSHDLRTPLIVITGYADLLEIDLAKDPVRLEYIHEILEACERIERMLDNMLRVEKVRSNPDELYERVMLPLLAQDTIEQLMPLAAHKSINLRLRVSDDPIPDVHGDPMLLRQAMENLVSNAIKYTPTGGEVLVEAFCRDERFHFVVRDTGIGIQADELPLVFDSYYRAQNANQQSTSGVGLGLSLVKNAVTQHGGGVWVDSEEGVGSTFGFWLPLSY